MAFSAKKLLANARICSVGRKVGFADEWPLALLLRTGQSAFLDWLNLKTRIGDLSLIHTQTKCQLTRMYGPPRDCKGKRGREDKSAQMYSAFSWRVFLLAMMRCARVCPYKRDGRGRPFSSAGWKHAIVTVLSSLLPCADFVGELSSSKC